MGLLPTQKPATAGRWVCGGGEWGSWERGVEACVTTARQWMELGWGYYLPRNLPQLVDGCVCVRRGGEGRREVGGEVEGCVTTARQWMELGWGYYLPRNLTCQSWSMGVYLL